MQGLGAMHNTHTNAAAQVRFEILNTLRVREQECKRVSVYVCVCVRVNVYVYV